MQRVSPIPHKVDTIDLQSNGKLYNDAQIELIEELMKKEVEAKKISTFRMSKKMLATVYKDYKYGIIYSEGNIFAIYKLQGKGAFGRVRLVQNLQTGVWAAYKIQRIGATEANYNPVKKNDVDAEITALKNLGLLEVGAMSRCSAKKIEYQLNFIMKLIPGYTLDQYIRFNTELNYDHDVWLDMIIATLKAGSDFYSKKRYLHRDIKPDNIMYDMRTHIATLIDFGRSVPLEPGLGFYRDRRYVGAPLLSDYPQRRFLKETNFRGTIRATPFVYSDKSEIFAYACTIAELLDLSDSLDANLQNFNPETAYIAKVGSPFFNNNKVIKNRALRADIVNYLEQMTSKNAAERPDFSAAIIHFENLKMIYSQQSVLPFSLFHRDKPVTQSSPKSDRSLSKNVLL